LVIMMFKVVSILRVMFADIVSRRVVMSGLRCAMILVVMMFRWLVFFLLWVCWIMSMIISMVISTVLSVVIFSMLMLLRLVLL